MSLRVNLSQTSNETDASKLAKGSKKKTSYRLDNQNKDNNPILEKRNKARQQAFKIVSAAWDNDIKIDKSIDERKNHILDMAREMKTANDEIAKCDDEISKLDTNDVEYETRIKEINDRQDYQKELRDKAIMNMQADISNITSIGIERLKSDPMRDANKQADAIMEALSKDIMSVLMNEVKDNVDETAKEVQEKAEDKAKENKEEEEKKQEAELKRAITQALISGTKEAVNKVKSKESENNNLDIDLDKLIGTDTGSEQIKAASESLKDVKNSMKLLEAELKGIQIDESL